MSSALPSPWETTTGSKGKLFSPDDYGAKYLMHGDYSEALMIASVIVRTRRWGAESSVPSGRA